MTRRLLEPEAAEDFSRQHLANLIWSLATLEYDPGGCRCLCASLCQPACAAVLVFGATVWLESECGADD